MSPKRVPLTIVLFDVFELDESYLDLYFRALRDWNADGMTDAQVLMISQRENARAAHEVCSRQPFRVDLIHARQEYVAGYPVWDVLSSLRLVWPLVDGQYVTFAHPEFIWGPGRLRKTLDWLRKQRPYYAIGNLRRPGSRDEIFAQNTCEHCIRVISELLRDALTNGDAAGAAEISEKMPNSWWMFWCDREPNPGRVPYMEDIFFADREWLDAWRFIEHGGELPFQDVYDLMGAAIATVLSKHAVTVPCVRMDLATNKLIHLWHRKLWRSWSPEIRDWFLADPKRWGHTKFMDRSCWEGLIAAAGAMPATYQPMNAFRHQPGGTVHLFRTALSKWIEGGGKLAMEKFYAANGRERRTA